MQASPILKDEFPENDSLRLSRGVGINAYNFLSLEQPSESIQAGGLTVREAKPIDSPVERKDGNFFTEGILLVIL